MDRKKVERVIAKLDYDWDNFQFDHFLSHVITQRGRHIEIKSMPKLAFSGYCVSVKQHQSDYIFITADDHPISILHNKIHELGHFLLDHLEAIEFVNSYDELTDLIMMRFSRLRSYEEMTPALRGEEHEAEYFAYLIEGKIAQAKRLYELKTNQESYNWGVPPFYGRFARKPKRKGGS